MGYRIRRNRSALATGALFGPERRVRQRQSMLYWIVVCTLIGGLFIIWQRESISPIVMGVLNSAATPTPTANEYGRRGNLAFIRGDLDTAIDSYRQAAAQRPDDIGILYELTRMLVYRNYNDDQTAADDRTEALQWAQRAVDATSSTATENGRAYTALCFAQITIETYTEAARSCLRAIELSPDDAEAHAFLALAYFNTERVTEALEEGREAVNLNPESIDANSAYARLLNSVRRFDQALEYYQKAASINPRLEYPYFELGLLARLLGNDDPPKFDIAIAAYNQVLSTNRRSVKAYMRLCQTYLAKGEPNLAQDNCITATNIDAENSEAWYRLGRVQYSTSQFEEAVTSLTECYNREKLLPENDRWAECWYFLGLSYVLLDKCEIALPIFYDLLNWTSDEYAIEMTNKGLTRCNTPLPTNPPPTADSTEAT